MGLLILGWATTYYPVLALLPFTLAVWSLALADTIDEEYGEIT